MVWLTSILKAQINTAVGSIPRCCNLAARRAARPIGGVLTHGFTLDEKGMKMSKSSAIPCPEMCPEQYGADILRLWVAQSDYTSDSADWSGDPERRGDSYRRLRNTMRFMLGLIGDFTEADRVGPEAMPELEQWVLHRLASWMKPCEGLCGL